MCIRDSTAHIAESMVREINAVARGPVTGKPLAFVIQTGDNSDNSQHNEIRWNIDILDGGRIRADSGDLELDLIELFSDVAALAGDLGVGIALFIDEMQDVPAPELSALCGACHEISQQSAPLLVVGAGLPHLPVALAASKSYAERLFRYVSVDRLPREMANRAWRVPAGTEGVEFQADALDELYRLTDGYPYFVQAYGKVTWDAAVGSPIALSDVAEAAPEAEAELAVGFFGARYDRATPAERDYMTAMADLGADNGDGAIATSEVARHLDRKPQSLSPARDGLIKKGLVYSAERGSVAFTVPHFGKFLRSR